MISMVKFNKVNYFNWNQKEMYQDKNSLICKCREQGLLFPLFFRLR